MEAVKIWHHVQTKSYIEDCLLDKNKSKGKALTLAHQNNTRIENLK